MVATASTNFPTHASLTANDVAAVLFDFGGTLDADGLPWKERVFRLFAEEGVVVTRERFDPLFYTADDALVGTIPRTSSFGETVARLAAGVAAALALPDRMVAGTAAPPRPRPGAPREPGRGSGRPPRRGGPPGAAGPPASKMGRPPPARAPAMSRGSESPTKVAAAGPTPRASSATRKIRGSGFAHPTSAESTRTLKRAPMPASSHTRARVP